jgi:hypothetical protein
VFTEAIAAINGPVSGWPERHFAGLSAVSAGGLVHLRSTVIMSAKPPSAAPVIEVPPLAKTAMLSA